METRREQAVEKRNKGYNCAQAVACTYCDKVGLDEEMIFKITEAMGVGMGNMEGTCGALTGAGVILGLLNSTANLEQPDSKAATLKLSRKMMEQFGERNKSVLCKDLKGRNTGVVLRSCPDCVRDACELLEQLLEELEVG